MGLGSFTAWCLDGTLDNWHLIVPGYTSAATEIGLQTP